MSFCQTSCLSNVHVLNPNSLTEQLLTKECLQFLATLQRLHNKQRKNLLAERAVRAELIDKGLFTYVLNKNIYNLIHLLLS